MMEMQLSKLRILEEVNLGVDICPHSLDELAHDITALAKQYQNKETHMEIEGNCITIYGKQRALILDADEVIFDWPKAFVAYANKRMGTSVEYGPYHQCIENLFGYERGQMENLMQDFNSSVEFGDCDIFLGAKHVFQYVNAHNYHNPDDSIKIYIVTKCGTGLLTQLLREHNLKQHIGAQVEFEIIYLDITESKHDALKNIHDTHEVLAFFDDFTTNCDVATDLGINTYAVEAYHNAHLRDSKSYLQWVPTNSMLSVVNDLIQN